MRTRHTALAALLLMATSAATAADAPDQPPDFASSNLFGTWGGARDVLYQKGIELQTGYEGEFAHNASGGIRHTDGYADQFHLGAHLDLGKLWNWQGASFHISIHQRNGDLLENKAHIDDLFQTQEIYGYGHVARLTQFFFEQKLWNNLVDLRVGRMSPGANGARFMTSSCDFQTLSGCGSLPGDLGNGWYNSPIGQYGAVLTVNPAPTWYVRLGALDSNQRNTLNSQGLKITTPGGWNNTLSIAELGWTPKLGAQQLPGAWALGAWHNGADYADLFQTRRGVPLPKPSQDPFELTHDSENGFYVMARQQVSKNQRGGGLTVFANMVAADQAVDRVDQLLEVGLVFKGPFASRSDDRMGLLQTRGRVSRRVGERIRARNQLTGQSQPVPRHEYTTELNYKLALLPGLFVMPNVQYVRNPGGFTANHDALVLGMRVSAKF